jgi:hypothetical protein
MSGHAYQAHRGPARLIAGGPCKATRTSSSSRRARGPQWQRRIRYPSPDPNRRVRSRFTPPERRKFETRAGFALPNILNFLTSHNLTKMAVVQLRRRKWPERGRKRPKWPFTPGAVVRKYRRERPNPVPFRPSTEGRKRMSRLGVLAEGSSLAPNTLFAGFAGRLPYPSGSAPSSTGRSRLGNRAVHPPTKVT